MKGSCFYQKIWVLFLITFDPPLYLISGLKVRFFHCVFKPYRHIFFLITQKRQVKTSWSTVVNDSVWIKAGNESAWVVERVLTWAIDIVLDIVSGQSGYFLIAEQFEHDLADTASARVVFLRIANLNINCFSFILSALSYFWLKSSFFSLCF